MTETVGAPRVMKATASLRCARKVGRFGQNGYRLR